MSVGHIKPKVVTHGNNFCEDGLLLSTHFRNFKSSICTGPRSFATGRPLSTRGSARSAKMPKKNCSREFVNSLQICHSQDI
jgi:hypothetical protein